MALNLRRGLKDLVIGRKGSSSKDSPQTQLPPNPPLPVLPSSLGLHPNPNLQNKKRKGRFCPRMTRSSRKLLKIDRPFLWKVGRSPMGLRFADSNAFRLLSQNQTELPFLRTLQFGTSREGIWPTLLKPQSSPFLLLRDIEAISRIKQPDLFLSLKMDLAIVVI